MCAQDKRCSGNYKQVARNGPGLPRAGAISDLHMSRRLCEKRRSIYLLVLVVLRRFRQRRGSSPTVSGGNLEHAQKKS